MWCDVMLCALVMKALLKAGEAASCAAQCHACVMGLGACQHGVHAVQWTHLAGDVTCRSSSRSSTRVRTSPSLSITLSPSGLTLSARTRAGAGLECTRFRRSAAHLHRVPAPCLRACDTVVTCQCVTTHPVHTWPRHQQCSHSGPAAVCLRGVHHITSHHITSHHMTTHQPGWGVGAAQAPQNVHWQGTRTALRPLSHPSPAAGDHLHPQAAPRHVTLHACVASSHHMASYHAPVLKSGSTYSMAWA